MTLARLCASFCSALDKFAACPDGAAREVGVVTRTFRKALSTTYSHSNCTRPLRVFATLRLCGGYPHFPQGTPLWET